MREKPVRSVLMDLVAFEAQNTMIPLENSFVKGDPWTNKMGAPESLQNLEVICI